MQLNIIFDIDIAIFLLFLAINLVVSIKASTSIGSLRSFALGDRNFSTGVLIAIIVTTWASASSFFTIISKTFDHGLYFVLATLTGDLSILIVAFVFIPKMAKFLGKTSIAEAMGELYGDKVRIITAVTGFIVTIGTISLQLKALGYVFGGFLGIPITYATILSGLTITIYCVFGSVRAVTFTDVIQFIAFGVAIPCIGLIIWQQFNTEYGSSLTSALQHPRFSFKELFNTTNPEFWNMLPLFAFFAIPSMTPPMFQRISMGSSTIQAKKAFIIAAIILILFKISIAWIPFLIFHLNSGLKSGDIFNHIVDYYTYTGLKGILMIAVAAMAMSTADSYINSSSVLLVNDICTPLKIGRNPLVLSRIVSFLLGIFAIILALNIDDFFNVILKTRSFYMPIVSVPFMITVLGTKLTTRSVLISMSTGLTAIIIWEYILAFETTGIPFAMALNLVSLLISHYLLDPIGKKDQPNNSSHLYSVLPANKDRAGLFNNIRHFNYRAVLRRHAPKNELLYTAFGVFCIIYTLTIMYSTPAWLNKDQENIILIIYQIMIITSICMATYPIWPPLIKSEIFIQIAWPIAIFYMLIVSSSFFVIVSKFSHLQLVIFSINMVTAAVLIGWRLALGMVVIGFYLSTQLYKYHTDIDSLETESFIFIYALLMVGTAVIAFIKPKEEQQEFTETKLEHFDDKFKYQEEDISRAREAVYRILANVNHELRIPVSNVNNLSGILYDNAKAMSKEKIISYLEKVYESSNRLASMVVNMLDLANLEVTKIDIQKTNINLSTLLIERLEACKKIYLGDKDLEFAIDIEPNVIAHCDSYYISHAMDNIIINAILYTLSGTISVNLSKTDKEIEFGVQDNGIGVPKEELLDIFEPFNVSSRTRSPAGGRGVGLALSKSVIRAHKGQIWAENRPTGTLFKFILPAAEH